MTAEVAAIFTVGALAAWAMWLTTTRIAGLLTEIVAEVRALRRAAQGDTR